MQIFQKSLINEITYYSGVVLLMTGGIFSVVKYLELLRSVAKGHFPFEGLTLILLLKLVTFLDVILAPTMLIAVMLVLMRLRNDNEITIYSVSAIGPAGFFLPAAIISLTTALIVASLSFVISPFAELKFQHLLSEYQQRIASVPLSEGQFRSTGRNNSVVYLSNLKEESDPVRLFIFDSNKSEYQILSSAQGAHIENLAGSNRTLVLGEGRLVSTSPEWEHLEFVEFSSYTERTPILSSKELNLPAEVKSIRELISSASKRDLMEINWRLSKVFSVIVVILLGFALGVALRKSSVNLSLVGAVILYFLYNSLLGFLAELSFNDQAIFAGILWLPHIAMLAFIMWLIVRGQSGFLVFPWKFKSPS